MHSQILAGEEEFSDSHYSPSGNFK